MKRYRAEPREKRGGGEREDNKKNTSKKIGSRECTHARLCVSAGGGLFCMFCKLCRRWAVLCVL